jgi:hypothetical protein
MSQDEETKEYLFDMLQNKSEFSLPQGTVKLSVKIVFTIKRAMEGLSISSHPKKSFLFHRGGGAQ